MILTKEEIEFWDKRREVSWAFWDLDYINRIQKSITEWKSPLNFKINWVVLDEYDSIICIIQLVQNMWVYTKDISDKDKEIIDFLHSLLTNG